MGYQMRKIVDGQEVELTPEEIQELEAFWAEGEIKRLECVRREYVANRREVYPNIGDQLDVILKQLNYMQMSGQTDLIAEMDDLIGAWLKVKRDFPKPDEGK